MTPGWKPCPADLPPPRAAREDALAGEEVAGAGTWWGRPLAETRWQLELYRLLVDPVFRGADLPRGDGRPVLLLPGFIAGDYSLAVMAGWLRRIGYQPHTAGIPANVDCSDRALERVERRVEALAGAGRRVALVGHSRGGHLARAMARRRPDHVSHVIALGAGLDEMLAVSAPTRAAVALARAVNRHSGRASAKGCLTEGCSCAFGRDFGRPFPEHEVRLTSVYSRGDGVVRWQACVVPYADCVEVTGSHVGLAFNRKAYRAIAEALAAPEL